MQTDDVALVLCQPATVNTDFLGGCVVQANLNQYVDVHIHTGLSSQQLLAVRLQVPNQHSTGAVTNPAAFGGQPTQSDQTNNTV